MNSHLYLVYNIGITLFIQFYHFENTDNDGKCYEREYHILI